MTVSKAEIEKYLLDVFGAIRKGRYQIASGGNSNGEEKNCILYRM